MTMDYDMGCNTRQAIPPIDDTGNADKFVGAPISQVDFGMYAWIRVGIIDGGNQLGDIPARDRRCFRWETAGCHGEGNPNNKEETECFHCSLLHSLKQALLDSLYHIRWIFQDLLLKTPGLF
ncbi:MAG: hypothetical protein FJZ96_05865 [Chloroflexi bacterium]|nr:hypothetical protein [Chloroflexota bacterium]